MVGFTELRKRTRKKKAGEYWRGEKATEVVIISLNDLFQYTSSWCNLWLVTSTLPQQVILVTQKERVRLPCAWNRGIHNNFCVEQILVQWNPVNMDTKGTCHSVRIIRVSVLSGLSLKNIRNTCFIDIKTKADSFTNQGSVEVCGKAVNRGGGLGMEIPCVYIFYGPCPRDKRNCPYKTGVHRAGFHCI